MQLVVLGLNHKTAPVEIREKFALSHTAVKSALAEIPEYESIGEMAILSTCNRTEIYAVLADEVSRPCCFLRNFIDTLVDGVPESGRYFYCYSGEACIRHLFKVAASLDSLVLGEGQILSQVKKAYALAREMNTTGTVLNIFFHRAISLGKRVRTETLIAHNTVSVSSAAVGLAEARLQALPAKNILLVGAGKMGELTALNLRSKGCTNIFIANRDPAKACQLAEKVQGKPVLWDSVAVVLSQMDAVITSTGSTDYIIGKTDLEGLAERKNGTPLILIDIAVPRDIDPEVVDITGVELYNMDDMEQVVEEHRKLREQEAVTAEVMVKEETKLLIERFHYLSLQPVMVLLANRTEKMRKRELKRALAKLTDLSPEEERVLEHMTQAIVRKMLREPMTQLNHSAGGEHEDYYVQAVKKIFKLDTMMGTSDEEIDYWDAQEQTGLMAGATCTGVIADHLPKA